MSRWNQEFPSPFPWEQEALDHIRALIPDIEPYRAWATFTFSAQSGKVHENDLLVCAPAGLFLVEIKSHPGRVENRGNTWIVHRPGGKTSSFTNPLPTVDAKAKDLKSRLRWAARELGFNESIPFIDAAVFLSDPGLGVNLDEQQLIKVYGREDGTNGLPRIWSDFLNQPPRSQHRRVTAAFEIQLPRLMHKIGVAGSRRYLRLSRWQMDAKPIDSGPTWEDRLARDEDMRDDQRRIRIYLSRRLASADDQRAIERAARREYNALRGLTHRGIVQVADFHIHEAGPAVLFHHLENDLRLDHYLDQYGDTLDVGTRLGMVRQLAEALNYAHGRHLFHRALAARCVWVTARPDGAKPTLRVGDWQTATHNSDSTGLGSLEPSSLSGRNVSAETHVYLAPEFKQPDADPLAMDVFGLGALAHLVITGKPPAPSRRELADKLRSDEGLLMSTMVDGIPADLDGLIWHATHPNPNYRIHAVADMAVFLDKLDAIQENLTRADDDETDPLDLVRGQVIDGEWEVSKVLGSGSTAKAILVKRIGPTPTGEDEFRVLKVALDDEKAESLHEEAVVLRLLHDSHIVRWLEGPFTLGERTVIAVEQAGQDSLGQRLRTEGPCSIHELEQFGDDLFAALDHLAGNKVWHRDIKPDNLGVRRRRDRSQQLVLFDFSHARTPERDIEAGTRAYLDPFLGTDRRPVYDSYAEWYAAAVTLHEMASGERPLWGGGAVDPQFTDEEVPPIAAEAFDPALRDGLVAFFTKALYRDIERRFQTLREMRDAWRTVFTQLDAQRPPTTSATVGSTAETTEEARDAAADQATLDKPLDVAGLSPRAVAAAATLGAQTVGELLAVPPYKVTKVRGVGRTIRSELLRRIRQWKLMLTGGEPAAEPAAEPVAPIRVGYLDDLVTAVLPHRGRKNSMRAQVLRLLLGLPDEDGSFSDLPGWPAQTAVATSVGTTPVTVSRHLRAAGDQWSVDDRVNELRTAVVEILDEASRVMEVGELAAALLERRGARADDERVRVSYAYAAARIAVETEVRGDEPRVDTSRHGDRVLVALESLDGISMPSGPELTAYAAKLGKRADELAAVDPLPGPATVLRELRAIPVPEGMPAVPDSRLVALAAAASNTAAATARLELYPLDLSLDRALRMTQGSINPGPDGLDPADLLTRVRSRFPALSLGLSDDPTPRQIESELSRALDRAGFELILEGGRFRRRPVPGTLTALASSTSFGSPPPRLGAAGDSPVLRRLAAAVDRGGFLALNVRLRDADLAADVLARCFDVTAVDVGAEFVQELQELAGERKRAWSDVLRADERFSRDGTLPRGLAGYVREVWKRLAGRLAAHAGVLLLCDAGVFARYPGGREVLVGLQQGTRLGRGGPRGVWLLCPVPAPKSRPVLDSLDVEIIGENEWLELPSDVLRSLTDEAA